ncbi:PAS domain S-box protein, partial [Candidatus Omnitrophota bacterium]
MLEYVIMAGINSKIIKPMKESKDRSALELGVDFTGDLDEVDINFDFRGATDYEKGRFRLVPCTIKTTASKLAIQYWCYIRALGSADERPDEVESYNIIFFTESEVKQKDFSDRINALKHAERAKYFAVSRGTESEREHDEKIRRAISEGAFDRIKKEYKPLDSIYKFLNKYAPILSKDFKKLVDAEQLMIIKKYLKTPHAGGKGIYIPQNDMESGKGPGIIVHEVFAKAGFTHKKCEMFQAIFERSYGRSFEGVFSTPEEKRLRKAAKSARFIDLTEVIETRDYSGEQEEEEPPKTPMDISLLRKEQQKYEEIIRDLRAALQESEERFRDLYENCPFGIHDLTLDGEITNLNQHQLDLLGYEKHEKKDILGKRFTDFIPEEQRGKAFDRFKSKIAGEKPPTRKRNRWYLPKKGPPLIVSTNDRPIWKHGKIAGIRTWFRNITKSKQEEDRIRALLEELPAAVFYKELKDGELITVYANTKFYELHGLDPKGASIEGLTDFQIREKFNLGERYNAEKFNDDDMGVYNGGNTVYSDEAMGYGYTEPMFVLVSKKRVGDGVLGIFADITATKKAEQVLAKKQHELELELEQRAKELKKNAKMAAIGEMASKITHDFNGPLSVIIGYLNTAIEILAGMPGMKGVVGMLTPALQSAKLLVAFTTEILEFSSIGVRKVKLSPVSLREILEKSIINSGPSIAEHGVALSKYGTDQEVEVMAEERDLQRIYMNLITNACRAMGAEKVRSLEITLSKDEDKG